MPAQTFNPIIQKLAQKRINYTVPAQGGHPRYNNYYYPLAVRPAPGRTNASMRLNQSHVIGDILRRGR